jgi:heme-degrading monooxygenase HmoA
MIARIWKGRTRLEHYEDYTDFTRRNAVPDYSNTEGFIGLSFLRKKSGTEAHFTLITYWKDIDAIKRFAGDDYERAKYYPEDQFFLLEFPERVEHFEVFAFQREFNDEH